MVVPEIVHTDGVNEVRVTERPEDAVGDCAIVKPLPPQVCAPGLAMVIV
jgi:hypothetical protein